MPRHFKIDRMSTKAAQFKNRASYISFRIHPGTDHPCQYLKGKDVEIVRLQVFEREKGRCLVCGAYHGWDYGEMHHVSGGSGADRCSCLENLSWLCGKCHRMTHGRYPKFSQKG